MRILVLNGPNLNLLGEREPEVYGTTTLEDVETALAELADELGVEIEFFQSNSEGALIDRLHDARHFVDGVVYNPGAHTHYSYALRDAVASITPSVIEVHLSDIAAREEFRRTSVIAPVCIAQVTGLGLQSYLVGLKTLVDHIEEKNQ